MSLSSDVPIDWDALTYQTLNENLSAGQRWSTWDDVDHGTARGPEPWPEWLVRSQAAIDTDLGVLKTGKEADVYLLERAVPDGPTCLLAAKRYRSAKHRLFHRDSGYTEGRRGRDSRENRAVHRGSAFGRRVEAGRWAAAEFSTLKLLWSAGVRVPYPVQIDDTEILMEYIDDAGAAAPRLAQTSPDPHQLQSLWTQVVDAMTGLAVLHLAHGDLSPYNVLVRGLDHPEPELIVIDVPQVVDLVANPSGVTYLQRDCDVMASWFVRRGHHVDAGDLLAHLLACAW